ncbi:MAG: hypothetical protein ACYC27_10645 [Armatimonadota bacterium]
MKMAITSLLMLSLAVPAFSEPPAFKVGIELPVQLPISKKVENALKDMGINYINYYVYNGYGADNADMPVETNNAAMALAEALGADFSIAAHAFDPPDECVKAAVEHGKGNGRFRGVLIDELEHIRLLWLHGHKPIADVSKFDTFEHAYEGTLKGYRNLVDKFAAMGAGFTSTHVWPVLHHTAARAGSIVCPKIAKEYYSPVSMAIGMGAAKQYDRELWADIDMWFYDTVPGHTPEEIKCNLLFAYWMGVDLIYLEGAGYNLYPAGKQGTPFSLMSEGPADKAQLTPIGETLRWFCREYVPNHPRKWTFRDIKPDIAIVRFDDTCHGQRYTSFPDNLFGSEKLHSTPDTEAWFQIWNLLTFGKTGREGLSYFRSYLGAYGWDYRPTDTIQSTYLTRPMHTSLHPFFMPMNGAVVYDHLVEYDKLKDVPLIFLTGIDVSSKTMDAIRKRVNEGATCVAWGPLALKNGFKDWKSGVKVTAEGKGKWILTDDFLLPGVYQEIYNYLGRADEIKYKFTQGEVVLRRINDNEVDVQVR